MPAAPVIAAVAAVTSTAYAMYSGERADKEQNKARKKAERQAERQQNQAEQDANRANRRGPNAQGILDAASQQARGGGSGTMLTGAQGVAPSQLPLGKNTLLGG